MNNQGYHKVAYSVPDNYFLGGKKEFGEKLRNIIGDQEGLVRYHVYLSEFKKKQN